jgi:hypothetical protein
VQLIYSGPLGEQSSALIAYLEDIPGVHPITPGENPATWMLEVRHFLPQPAMLGCCEAECRLCMLAVEVVHATFWGAVHARSPAART